ncbi:MAG: carbohydrate kinase family protein [Candidatus Aenigmarchaeota archaeon]|nr:carbohydrate kinase family protein [Candidatus Aenigmarchaeota archaeon]
MPAPKGKGILAVGGVIVDLIMHSPDQFRVVNGNLCFPFDSKLQVEEFTFDIGGSAHNVAANASSLGSKTYILACIGDEPYGEMAIQNLKTYNVDTKYVSKVKDMTGMSVVLIHEGEKTILTYRGANDYLGEEKLNSKILNGIGTVVITSMISPENVRITKRLVDEAQKRKIEIVANPSISMVNHQPEALKYVMKKSQVIIMNGKEAQKITGCNSPQAALEKLKSYGAKTIIVTLDVRGCIVYDEEAAFHVPAFKVKVVDTTGGGDSFTAGFVHAKARGFNTLEAVRFAGAVAALNILTPGASTDLPTEKEAIKYMKNAKYNYVR